MLNKYATDSPFPLQHQTSDHKPQSDFKIVTEWQMFKSLGQVINVPIKPVLGDFGNVAVFITALESLF